MEGLYVWDVKKGHLLKKYCYVLIIDTMGAGVSDICYLKSCLEWILVIAGEGNTHKTILSFPTNQNQFKNAILVSQREWRHKHKARPSVHK